jgi:chromosomal replication initiator protein
MPTCKAQDTWIQFIEYMQKNCSETEFQNWLAPIKVVETNEEKITLEVPNIFVKEYLIDNYKKDLCKFLPLLPSGEPSIEFVIKKQNIVQKEITTKPVVEKTKNPSLNPFYTFENFIEGPSNQFVKSAALGVAYNPGKSFNPLFIHGGVGLGKTHLLHGIGHYVAKTFKKKTVQCVTTETFINDLVHNLRNKSVDKMKRFYRNVDVLLVDDIQFLQNRLNFEEEFCNTFETLINQNKQIVITSDKPPSQLKLSERMIARMEWGLVAHIGMPEVETRVAIIQHKAVSKGFSLPNNVSFFIAENVYSNVRQLEGAINRLCAYARLMHAEITINLAENLLKEFVEINTEHKISVDNILKTVATAFDIKISEIRGDSRLKNIALPRQIAMYLSKELLKESLSKIASSFGGKTHSTLIHAWKKISKQLESDTQLKRQIDLVRKNLQN